MKNEKPEILFLGSGPFALNRREENDKFKYFSDYYSCYILSSVNLATKEMTGLKETEIKKDITLIPFSYYYKNAIIRNFFSIYNLISKSLWLYYIKKRKFKVVISGNPFMGGICALIISKLTGAKSIVEVQGNFKKAFIYGSKSVVEPQLIDKLKLLIADLALPFVLKNTDAVKLEYSTQLNSYKIPNETLAPIYIFPNIVNIKSFINEKKLDKKYLLLVGYPWFLKGVDILIKAFNNIYKDFPNYKLKIVGWCPDSRDYYEYLAKDNPNIELCNPVPHKEIIAIMNSCSVYVLASRTDASPRVLREAMASKKPIIATNVDGVPELIKDGYNGLLFENENIDQLSEKIKLLLSDNEYAQKLAQNAYKSVQEKFSEEIYIDNYKQVIDKLAIE